MRINYAKSCYFDFLTTALIFRTNWFNEEFQFYSENRAFLRWSTWLFGMQVVTLWLHGKMYHLRFVSAAISMAYTEAE